jgi:serine/threonine protein kinase
VVYEAHDSRADHRVAIKLLYQLDIRAYDYGEHKGIYYLILEFVDGITLREALKDSGSFSTDRTVGILSALLRAVAAAHSQGIMHRDIKPGNVILTGQPGSPVKLIDFGLAKVVHNPDGQSLDPTQLTRAGNVVGSLRYMSPEQIRGEELTAATDVFSLGLLALEMLSGEHPMEDAASDYVVAIAMADGSGLRVPETLDVPERLRNVVDKMLAPDPATRYATASEALQDLEQGDATTVMMSDAIQAAMSQPDEHDAPTAILENVSDLDIPVPRSKQQARRRSYVSLIPDEADDFGAVGRAGAEQVFPEPVNEPPPAHEPSPKPGELAVQPRAPLSTERVALPEEPPPTRPAEARTGYARLIALVIVAAVAGAFLAVLAQKLFGAFMALRRSDFVRNFSDSLVGEVIRVRASPQELGEGRCADC